MATRRPRSTGKAVSDDSGPAAPPRNGAAMPTDLAACHAELAALRARVAELELQPAGEQRNRISGRLDLAAVGHAELARDGCILKINRTAAELLRTSHPTVLGQPFPQYVVPADRPNFQALLEAAQDDPQRQVVELRLRAADGRELWVQMAAIAPPNRGATRITLVDIDRRKRAELALSESERRYRRLHESMTDAFACVDLSGRFLECNRAFTEMMGYSAEELTELTFRDLTPEPWLESTDRILKEQVLALGASAVYEKEYRRKDGSVFPAEVRVFLIRDDAGQPDAMWGTVRDITERKQAELALAQSELRYRRLHESMTDAFVQVDLHGRIQECNRAYCEMLGYSLPELQALTYADLTPLPWHGVEVEIVERQVLTGGGSAVYEKEYRRKDGTVFPVELRTFLIRDDADQPEAMWAIVRDITNRKQAERALAESELRYRRLHESMTDAFALVDMDGRIRECNRAYCEMLGYSVDELEALTYVDLTPERWHEVEAEIVEREILPEGASTVYEKEYRRKDGTVFPVEMRTFLIRNDDGEPEAMWAIVRDITNRNRVQDALRRERDLLASIMDTSPAGILVADSAGRLTLSNRRAQELLGLTREAITQRWCNSEEWRITDYDGLPLPDEELPFSRVMATGRAIHGAEHAVESADRRRVLLTVNSAPLADSSGNLVGAVAAFDDVTDRELAARELHLQLALKQAWLEAVPLPVCFVSNDGRLVECNAHFAVCLDRSRDAILGASMAELLPAAVAAEERLSSLGTFRPDVMQRYLVLMPTAGGDARIWIHKSPYHAADGSVAGHVLALVDVTAEEHLIDELRQARGSLRSLAAELVKAEERERKGLASEVHGGVAVALTVTQLRLAALELTVKDQAALEMVADLRDVVSEASTGVRAMLNSLSPTVLYEFGLAAALRKLSEATTARFGLPVDVSHNGPVEQLPEATAVMLYQVARELVHNVVKHAAASRVQIRVEAGEEEARLVVEDDGVGPPPLVLAGRFAATARFGLFSIRERIEHLGGQFRIEQGEPRGTAAVAIVPAAWPG